MRGAELAAYCVLGWGLVLALGYAAVALLARIAAAFGA